MAPGTPPEWVQCSTAGDAQPWCTVTGWRKSSTGWKHKLVPVLVGGPNRSPVRLLSCRRVFVLRVSFYLQSNY